MAKVSVRTRLVAASVGAFALLGGACTPTGGDGGPAPAPNPRLEASCGLDVSLLFDRSGSIGANNSVVADASQVLVDALNGSGSQIKLASFADTATVHPDGDAAGSTNIADLEWSSADGYAVPTLASDGGTNLEGGLEVLRRSPGGAGDLAIVFTDGNPNVHYLNLGNGHPGVHANLGSELTEAIAEANGIKSGLTHVLAIGVGDVTVDTLKAISGPNALGDGESIENTDYALVDGFEKLVETFRDVANKLCENTANVRTLFNGSNVAGSVVSLTASPTPNPWTAPAGATGPTAVDSTSATAAANYAWQPSSAGTSLGLNVVPPSGFDAGSIACEQDFLDGTPRVPVSATNLGGGSYSTTKDPGTALFCDVELETNIVLPDEVDVVLAFDLTSSMSGVVAQAQSEATDVIANLGVVSPSTSFEFGVVSYRDYSTYVDSTGCGLTNYSSTYGSGSDYPFLLNQPLSSTPSTVQATVNGLTTSGGYDGPESYSRALWELTQTDTGAAMQFRPGALRLVINFGDNIPHDPNINEGVQAGTYDTGLDLGRNGALDCGGDDLDFQDDTLAAMAATDTHLLHVNSSTNFASHWQYWASLTDGAYAELGSGQSLTQIVVDLLSQL